MDASDAQTASRSEINEAFENLRTNHSGSTDPAGGSGAGSVAYMFWLDDSGTDTLKGRDSSDSSWLSLGLWAANLGMVRHDGSQAMTGNLDLDGNDLLIDSDGDSFLHASADDTIDLVIGPSAAKTYQFTASAFDLNDAQIKDAQNSTNTNTPSGATSHQLEIDIAGTTYYIPVYSAAW